MVAIIFKSNYSPATPVNKKNIFCLFIDTCAKNTRMAIIITIVNRILLMKESSQCNVQAQFKRLQFRKGYNKLNRQLQERKSFSLKYLLLVLK